MKQTSITKVDPTQVVETNTQSVSVENFILKAIENNVSVETMEKLFALRQQVNAERAKEEYVKSLSQFQAACPIIKKTKKVLNKDGRTVRYMFAPLDSIVEQIKTPLSKNGLSYRWETKQEKGTVTAICYVTHVLGHTDSSSFTVDIDEEGYMTKPQKTASALTFAKRYSLCNAIGVSTGDEDIDATDVKKEPNVKSPKARIMFCLKQLGENPKTPDESKNVVKKLTTINLEEKNFEEIINRLEVLISEKNEN